MVACEQRLQRDEGPERKDLCEGQKQELGERNKAPTWQSQVQGEQRDKQPGKGALSTRDPHTHCEVPRPAALPSGGLRERQRPHVNELTRELHTQHSLRSTKMKDLVSKPRKNLDFIRRLWRVLS